MDLGRGRRGLLLVFGLIPFHAAFAAITKGLEVYLFLTGMMLLSETAREHGVFDWVAATAVNHAGQSTGRLFLLVYATGVVVTTFKSNDATAVVLTPAVFVANAASFVLPISNPANLVLYGGHMPPLGQWMGSFGLPSLGSIIVTFFALRLIERNRITGCCEFDVVVRFVWIVAPSC